MITKEILEKLRKEQFEYMRAKYPMGDLPKSMFIGGKFNFNNWNGADDLIRCYFYDVEMSDKWQIGYELRDGYLIVNLFYHWDQAFAIVIHYWLNNSEEMFEEIHDIYYFSWYKHRGHTDIAIKNGHIMTEDEYIELLNLIEKTGYEFWIGK
jgi:hypothetical protein